ASDVYALGVLLYLLLAGRHPHPGARRSGYELERAVVEAEPVPPSAGLRGGAGPPRVRGSGVRRRWSREEPPSPPQRLPPRTEHSADEIAASRGVTPERLERRLRGDLDAIVLRALRKEPGLRYATADQLADDVGRHLEGRPVLARRGTRLYSASRLVRRHRMAVVAAGIVALSLVGGATATAWQARVAASERDRARAEAATSARVSAFLEELFRVSDPTEGRGAVVTARELLDRGSARIERELAAEPEAQAALMAVMGRAYGNLGEYARAAALLEATLKTQRGTLGTAHPEVARTLLELARVRAAQGDLAAAERHAREALGLGTDAQGSTRSATMADALESLGEILHQKGDLSRAETHLREALALRRGVAGDRDPAVATNLNALAHLLATRGELVAAEPLYREALRIERSALGNEHPDVGTTLNDLAVLLYRRNDYAGSEGLMREALEVQRRVLGNDHPEVAKTINNLAAVLEKQGKLAEAEPLYREALERKRAALGPEHASVAVSMSNLALLLSDRGDHAEADSLLRQSLALRRRLLGPDHPSVATALHNLASQSDRQGDRTNAERLYREVLAMRLRLLGPDHPDVATTRFALGLLLDDGGNHRDAEPLLREALRIRRLKLQPGAWHTAEAESALGACLLDQGRRAEAEPLLRSGHATLLRERGPDDRSTRRARERVERLK
ncbi:MAG TPA: tetratricopeptide repeat protein, partial [Longimicrobiaceae bacterium]